MYENIGNSRGFSLDRLDIGGGRGEGDLSLSHMGGDKALMGGLMRGDIDLMEGGHRPYGGGT